MPDATVTHKLNQAILISQGRLLTKFAGYLLRTPEARCISPTLARADWIKTHAFIKMCVHFCLTVS
jgi:hypothetical protein